MTLELLVENARIVDGTGDPWFRGTVGVTDGTISHVTKAINHDLDAEMRIDAAGVAPNVATLAGHGTVRYEVLGMDDVEPSEAELKEMASLIAEGLEDGAIGFSTGLVYTPQVHSSITEVSRLAVELRPYGRPFAVHIRSEGRWIWEALDEFFDIGAEHGIQLHISHFKFTGSTQHGKADRLLAQVEAARERGIDVTADQYPTLRAAAC